MKCGEDCFVKSKLASSVVQTSIRSRPFGFFQQNQHNLITITFAPIPRTLFTLGFGWTINVNWDVQARSLALATFACCSFQ